MALRIYDTFDAKKKDFVPVHEGKVGMYMCGMTVQGKPHVGHMLAFTSGDVIRRYLEHKGYQVTYVQNFTDVDDKIIARAAEEGVDFKVIAERYMRDYFTFADALNIRRATVHPRATEHIKEIVDLIAMLFEKGLAYEAANDVYYEISKFPAYGRLSKKRIDELRAGARIEVGEHKRSPLDFALWKGAKEGEPFWETPWGRGRPGWAVECSAMSMKYLGNSLDLHGGGEDLIFPHHENEIAQSEGATGQKFVRFWAHNGLLNLVGEKMSKSTGHFFAIEDILKEFEPDVVRFYLLTSHYRNPMEFSRERLADARAAVGRMRNTFRAIEAYVGEKPDGSLEGLGGADLGFWKGIEAKQDLFTQAMDDDINAAGAVGHIFDMARDLNLHLAGPETPAKRLVLARGLERVKELSNVLGILRSIGGEVIRPEDLPAEARRLVEERARARKAKDWAEADALRTQLAAQGYFVEDRPEGSIVRK
ncbi:MAG TPA: cysteine--tRNA ligase [bacterium]|nr:cysteine--tRNA ligase [bacterium]